MIFLTDERVYVRYDAIVVMEKLGDDETLVRVQGIDTPVILRQPIQELIKAANQAAQL